MLCMGSLMYFYSFRKVFPMPDNLPTGDLTGNNGGVPPTNPPTPTLPPTPVNPAQPSSPPTPTPTPSPNPQDPNVVIQNSLQERINSLMSQKDKAINERNQSIAAQA